MKDQKKTTCENTDAQLMALAMDPESASPELVEHLKQCGDCRVKKQELESDLAALGRLAKRLTPAMANPIRLPAEVAPAGKTSWAGRLLPAGGLALAAILGVWVVLATGLFQNAPGPGPNLTAQTGSQGEEAMEDWGLDIFDVNSLPDSYLSMIGETTGEDWDTDYYEDSHTEFLDFMAPITEGETMSRNFNKQKQIA